MGTNIVETEQGKGVLRPTTPSLPPELGRLLHRTTRDRPLRRGLTTVETETLTSLLPAYRMYLEPGRRDEISGLLTKLRAVYFVPDMSEGLAKAIADDWADDLGVYPVWLVKEACNHYRRTEQTKIPKPANIIALCKEQIENEVQEMREIELALRSPTAMKEDEAIVPRQNKWEDILETAGIGKQENPALRSGG